MEKREFFFKSTEEDGEEVEIREGRKHTVWRLTLKKSIGRIRVSMEEKNVSMHWMF